MKTLGSMTREEYRNLGFKCGLEVHQQLKTRQKLFCRCPNTTYSDSYDAQLLRHMRPTLSELGEYDPTALMEFKTRKEIIYRINRNTVCTYEMDDTPPFPINQEALYSAVDIALMLGANIVGELHIARKQYLDGSIPTGFQRTALVGVGGEIPVKGRKVRIRQFSIEEDSCREVSDQGHTRTFLTDRLSIPLIEVVTEPDAETPWEAEEMGQVIRRITRASGRVRTGAGAARQDVNVSIKGGTRVEIKGVPSLKMLPGLCHFEALRQKALLDIRKELHRRGVTRDDVGGQWVDVTSIVQRTSYPPILRAIAAGHRILAVRLRGFKDILSREIAPGVAFEREFIGRVKVVACLDRMPNLIHRDREDPDVSNRLWERVAVALSARDDDGIVLVWGNQEDTLTAAREILGRAQEALDGVPAETRRTMPDCSTTFERVLPGPNRMYPDTDLPPLAIPDAMVEEHRAALAALPWENEARYLDAGVSLQHAAKLATDLRRKLLDEMLGKGDENAPLIARLLVQELPMVFRRHPRRPLSEETISEILSSAGQGLIHREGVADLLDQVFANQGVFEPTMLKPVLTRAEATNLVEEILSSRTSTWLKPEPDPREQVIAMGLVMSRLRGLFSGRETAALVQEYITRKRSEEVVS